jgi:hypothetical protein
MLKSERFARPDSKPSTFSIAYQWHILTPLVFSERNYVQFGGLIETTLAIIKKQQAGETPIPAPPAEGETESKLVLNSEELYAETVDVFTKISQKDGADERAAPLSLIQLEVDRRKSDVKLGALVLSFERFNIFTSWNFRLCGT